jgi:transposase
MDQIRSDEPEGAPACAQNAAAGAPSGGAGPERRFSAQRKLAAATRLLRGEPLETLARELNVTVARLTEWRDRALVGAEAAMKERERDGRDG